VVSSFLSIELCSISAAPNITNRITKFDEPLRGYRSNLNESTDWDNFLAAGRRRAIVDSVNQSTGGSMEAFYKMFALTFLAERAAYANLSSYENHWKKLNSREIKQGEDNVYDTLLDHWDKEYTAHMKAKDALVEAWDQLTAEQEAIAQ
jgi:hypothetical protein